MIYLLADLGGTRIKAGVFDDKKIIASKVIDIDSKKKFTHIMNNLDDTFLHLIKNVQITKNTIDSIGIALPGIVDIHKNKVIAINEKYKDSISFNFNKWAQEKWNSKVVTDNDARAALAGIWQYGVGKNYENIVTMTLGTGVGGAALVEGKMIYGKHYQAGCLGGHFTVNLYGENCNCGNVGCVEALGSTWNLHNIVNKHPLFKNSPLKDQPIVDFELLFDFYRNNEIVSRDTLNDIMKVWAAGAVNLIHAYDPEIIVLGGGVLKSHDIIVPYMQSWINDHAWTPWGKVEIKVADSLENAALLGMVYLIEVRKAKSY